jgi:hypothetical protein
LGRQDILDVVAGVIGFTGGVLIGYWVFFL